MKYWWKISFFGTTGLIGHQGMQEKYKRPIKVVKAISKATGVSMFKKSTFLVVLGQIGVKDVMISIF